MKNILFLLLFAPIYAFGQSIPEIGDYYQGGYVFKINSNGSAYIASNIDLGGNTFSSAIGICNAYTSEGYNDWYLPSVDELQLMCQNIGPNSSQDVADIGPTNYWSSTTYIGTLSKTVNFNTCGISNNWQYDNFMIRAIRTVYFVYGCTDELASNYNPYADIEDNGSCEFECPINDSGEVYNVTFDSDGNLITNCYYWVWINGQYSVEQMTQVYNYDCSCVDNPIPGCMDIEAINFDSLVTQNDGSCVFAGCTYSQACNYNPDAVEDDGTCIMPPEGLNCDGSCVDLDLDGVCDTDEIFGCTDDTACNHNEEATENDNSCVYPEQYYNCYEQCINDVDEDGICDELEVYGCTYSQACNYDENATEIDYSCIFPEQFYDCQGQCLNDVDEDGICNELELYGCTDMYASNYNTDATEDDQSCQYNLYPISDSLFLNYLITNYPITIINDSLNILATNNITTINLDSLDLTNIDGIQYFDDLLSLDIDAPYMFMYSFGNDTNKLFNLPELPSNLMHLSIQYRQNIVLPELPNSLRSIYIRGCNLTNLPENLPDSLSVLHCPDNHLTDIPILPESLNTFYAWDNNFETIDLSIGLKSVILSRNYSLSDIGNLPPELRQLRLTSCPITSIQTLPNNLRELDLCHTNINYLPELPESLEELYIQGTPLINLPNLPDSLEILSFNTNASNHHFYIEEYNAFIPEINNPIECVNYYPTLYENQLGDFPHCTQEGCTSENALNYNPQAYIDDGSCIFSGCSYPTACNFNEIVSVEDGSCLFADYLYCETCSGETDGTGTIVVNDSDNDGVCDWNEVYGCSDYTACNFNELATEQDFSCVYPELYYDCFGQCINDSDNDGVCDELELNVVDYGNIGEECNSEIEEVNLDPMIIQYSLWEDYWSPSPGPSFESAIGFNVVTDSLILNLNIGNIWFYGGCILDVAYANVIFSISIFKDGNLLDTWDYNSVGGNDGCMMGPEYTTISSNINFPDQILVTQGNYELIFEVTESFFESAGLGFSLLINKECVSYGCNDSLACNYNPVANVNDNSCNYIENNCLCDTSCPNCQNITLPVGWSIFSSYMIPNSLYFEDIMTDLNQNNQIIIAKDYLGNAYLPEWNFNGIGDAIIGHGYLVKTSNNCILNICGDYAYPESNSILLNSGWNIIGYLRTEPANISLVFEEFTSTNNLIIAKDYLGNAFLPEWEFNGIGNMNPGQGYQLKINEESYFSYISNEDCYNESNYDCDGNLDIQIGDEAFGGIVFHIDSTGQHGLIASQYDVNPNAMLWGCPWEEINGADGVELGTGLQNSLDIHANCDDNNIAAKECLAYSFNDFDDWYLPSINELELMRNTVGQGGNNGNIMELNNSWYWSSTEVDLQFAKRLNATTGIILNDSKGNYNKVRPIRSF